MKICSSVPLRAFFAVSGVLGVLEQAVATQNIAAQRPKAKALVACGAAAKMGKGCTIVT
jgi:hypothetical protein